MTEIRRAHAGDVWALVQLEERVFHAEAWSRRLVTDAVPHALLAEGRGWVVVSVAGEVADLQRIAVETSDRRHGLGSALLTAAVDAGQAAGAERMLLEVREDNEAGRAFYAAAGFEEIDRRRRYYRDGADALVMQRSIRAGSTSGSGA